MSNMWVGENVRLRGVESGDWGHFRALAQHTMDVRNADLVEPPRSDDSFRSWTISRAERASGEDAFRLIIEKARDRTFAGTVTVGETDRRAGRFKIGIAIAREQRRRGYATEATQMILTYMFAEQRYNKCEVEVHASNTASLALYRKLGFTEEGRLRQHEFFAGAYQDVVLLGITAAEHWLMHDLPPVR
jgi:RimJ/RimL family protein N-acetyltransferase